MAGGRPTKWTPELQERICLHLSYGATDKAAAEAEGISDTTFERWLSKPEFCAAVTRARAQARTTKLALLHQAAARGSVVAMTWLLERLDPQAYGEPPKRVSLEGKDGGPLSLVLEVRQVARGDDSTDGARREAAGHTADHD